MRRYTTKEKMSNSTKILCRCGEIHNVKNSKLETFKCKSDVIEFLTEDEIKFRKNYIDSAKDRGLKFELSTLEFKQLVNSRCFYCGSPPEYKKSVNAYFNGIDRYRNDVGYVQDNCFS